MSLRLCAMACLPALLAVSACAPPQDTATHRVHAPCSPAAHLLLTATLQRLTPSRPFRVTPHATAWASTSNRPDQDQLFDGAAGIANVSVITGSAPVRTRVDERGTVLPTDPTVKLHATGHWYRLPVTAGTWRVYTIDRGNPRQVTVIGCPPR